MKLYNDPEKLLEDHECIDCGHKQGHGGTCNKCGSQNLINQNDKDLHRYATKCNGGHCDNGTGYCMFCEIKLT